jgi:glycosyltransferase involved in cell wall biosynthesis
MKIAFVTIGDFSRHATLKRATGMAKPLMEAGQEVAILLEDTPANREKVRLECSDATIFWRGHEDSQWRERRLKQKTIDEWKPDLVWICGDTLRNWVFRPARGCIILADHVELESAIQRNFVRRCVFLLMEWAGCLYYDGHICASRYLEKLYAKRLARIGRHDRVHYSPFANTDSDAARTVPDGNTVKRRFSGKKILFYMGSFVENYGFWDMLESFRILSRTRGDFVAMMIGHGPEKEKGEEWIRINGLENVIHIEGYVAESDLPAHFAAADVFICPLHDTVQDWARCPSKLYMYLPFYKPVVTCAVGEAAELFGGNGCYFRPGDITSLTARLVETLDHPERFPTPDAAAHTYKARTAPFLAWVGRAFSRV